MPMTEEHKAKMAAGRAAAKVARQAAAAPDTIVTPPPPAPETKPIAMAAIVIMVDHVYLPLDAAGDARLSWRDATDTVKVVKGTQLAAPRDLADFLSERKQAVIVR